MGRIGVWLTSPVTSQHAGRVLRVQNRRFNRGEVEMVQKVFERGLKKKKKREEKNICYSRMLSSTDQEQLRARFLTIWPTGFSTFLQIFLIKLKRRSEGTARCTPSSKLEIG